MREEVPATLTALTISNLVLWVLQIATIVVVLGLARQIGVLHLRLPAHGAGRTEDGPLVGARIDLQPVVSFRGEQTPVVCSGHLSVLTFANPECGVCGPTMEAVKRLRAREPSVRFIAAVNGEASEGLKYAAGYGLSDAVSAESLRVLGSNARPFAVVLSDDGTVLAAGVPNTLEQFETLLATGRYEDGARKAASATDLQSVVEEDAELAVIDFAAKAGRDDGHDE